MMKKMFTLLALLAMFLGANAKEVVDAEVDFSKYTDISQWNFPYSWGGSEQAKSRLSIQNGCLHFESSEVTVNDDGVETGWLCQFFPIGGVNAEVGTVYTLHYKIKGDHAENVSMLGFGQTPYGQFPITTDWVEGTVDYEAKSADGNILMQCGSYIGTWDIAYLKITHEERDNQRPKEWIPLEGFENGDAETPWADPNIGALDAENNYKVCAWGKENMSDPHPATIELEEGTDNHVFVVHSKGKVENDWDNQFWIMAPREIKNGENVKISFRYKASKNISASIQGHNFPSEYLNNFNMGSPSGTAFTTEWQTYEWEGAWEGGWSVVWNLNSNGDADPIDFYFDDLSISELKLDHGLFAASANTKTGSVAYNFDNAVELEAASGEIEWTNPQTGKKVSVDVSGTFVGTVGEKGKPDTWVNEVMISTVRGHDGSFKSKTIKPKGSFTGLDPDGWMDYEEASNAKISLPAAGAWLISVVPANDGKQMLFLKLDGEDNAEPIDIVTCTTEIVVKGVERDDLADDDSGVREEEGGTGQTWDNQFFIVANRVIEGGTETVIEFDYVSTVETSSPTGTHAKPGEYRKNAFGDVNFTTTENHFKADYTIPSADWNNNAITDAQTISFDMAVIKGACDYTIKNVRWYLKDPVNDEGKTFENLINADGSGNFFVKIGAGNSVVPYGDETGISSIATDKKANNVIYNLAGQRVSKDYKGIVIKNGAKYIAK